jgi:glycerophosphoryl diester phosphodiesterase
MLTVAHRGYSAAYPENTALAFERAIEAGAEFIETDVRFSRDGALVCSHDASLTRVGGDARAIADLTLAELQAVALARGQKTLALEDVLVIARGRAEVMLDVKVSSPKMAAAVVAALERTQMSRHVVYGARTVEHLRDVLQCASQVAILAMPASPELVTGFLAHELRAVRYWEDDVTPERIAQVVRAGREVWVTAGLRPRQEAPGYVTAARAAALAQMGVHAVLVNDPTVVRS